MAPQGDKGKGKEAEQSKPMGGPAMAKPAADKPGDKPGQGRAGGLLENRRRRLLESGY